mgnify:CR=1 FL=1
MWVKTKAGKNMPVDPTMISYRRPGAGVKAKEKIVTPEGEVVCADKVYHPRAQKALVTYHTLPPARQETVEKKKSRPFDRNDS